jgi:hypothetical protein
VTLAKGNRSKQVTAACKKHGGFYLGYVHTASFSTLLASIGPTNDWVCCCAVLCCTVDRSEALPPSWLRTVSRRWRWRNTPSWAWRPSGRFRCVIVWYLVRVLSAGVVSSKAPISLQVEDFPAFVVVDDKGNDFFSKWIP